MESSLDQTVAQRRQFMQRMTFAGLGVAAATIFGDQIGIGRPSVARAATTKPATITLAEVKAAFPGIPGSSVVEIVLNFALTLEILEADIYRQALNIASGLPITTPLKSAYTDYKLAVKPGFHFDQMQANVGFLYLAQFAFVEAAHRDFLIAAIKAAGGTPTKPNPGGYKFPKVPPPGVAYIVGAILPLEETGVRAYLGALPYLGDDLTYAQVAGAIYSTEARHSAAIRYNLGADPGPDPNRDGKDMKVVPEYPAPNTFEYFLTPTEVLSAASAYFA